MTNNSTTSSTTSELWAQWSNPGDVLTLLLLIGGDIVQKAIAQLVGHKVHLLGKTHAGLSIAPVAFSFGWVAYGFSNLLSAVGENRLMPTTDTTSIVVNCANAFSRQTRSWPLGRILRDHESRHEVDRRSRHTGGRGESLRIDIFELGPASRPSSDLVWWLGWATIIAQIIIAIPAWVLYSDWGIMFVVLSGNLLSAITCAMPQWAIEKWAGRILESDKVACLTQGNGHAHIMVFIGSAGSWDLESFATAVSIPRPETRFISLALAIAWTGLLISVSGLKTNAWFLVGIGGIGMLQNVFAAGKSRDPSTAGFHFTKFSRAPTIIGRRESYVDDADDSVDLEDDINNLRDLAEWAPAKSKNVSQQLEVTGTAQSQSKQMPKWLSSMSKHDGVPEWLEPISPERNTSTNSPSDATEDKVVYAANVQGALMELEKWVPTAGLSMVQIFFPSGLEYRDEKIRENMHKKFWKRAYATKFVRKRAEEKRRREERSRGEEKEVVESGTLSPNEV